MNFKRLVPQQLVYLSAYWGEILKNAFLDCSGHWYFTQRKVVQTVLTVQGMLEAPYLLWLTVFLSSTELCGKLKCQSQILALPTM